MDIRQERMEQLARIAFVKKIAEMLISTEAVSRDNDFSTFCIDVAQVVDEAEEHGVKTERLMGMYVILRLGDRVNPYDVPEYVAILDASLPEADKAHLLQMIRIGAVAGNVAAKFEELRAREDSVSFKLKKRQAIREYRVLLDTTDPTEEAGSAHIKFGGGCGHQGGHPEERARP